MTAMIPALCSEDELRERIVETETMNLFDGSRVHVKFSNGWGLSIIRHSYSYGGTHGLFEVAATSPDGQIDYHNPVTPDDVVGWLTAEDVVGKMRSLSSYSAEELKHLGEVSRYRYLESLEEAQDTKELPPSTPVSLVKNR